MDFVIAFLAAVSAGVFGYVATHQWSVAASCYSIVLSLACMVIVRCRRDP